MAYLNNRESDMTPWNQPMTGMVDHESKQVQPQIRAQMTDLECVSCELEKVTAALQERLRPVMSNRPVEMGGVEQKREPMAPLAEAIRESADRCRMVLRTVSGLLHSIEV